MPAALHKIRDTAYLLEYSGMIDYPQLRAVYDQVLEAHDLFYLVVDGLEMMLPYFEVFAAPDLDGTVEEIVSRTAFRHVIHVITPDSPLLQISVSAFEEMALAHKAHYVPTRAAALERLDKLMSPDSDS